MFSSKKKITSYFKTIGSWCIVISLSNFLEDVLEAFKVLQKWKRNYGGVITIHVFKHWRSYHFQGCNVFALSNFVEDVFQGFKIIG